MHRAITVVALLASLLTAHRAGATTAADIPCKNGVLDPCLLNGPITVDALSTLDFGTRVFQIGPAGTINVNGGDTLVIRAKTVTLQPGALIRRTLASATAPTVSIVTTADLQIQRSPTNSRGKIDVSADGGGGTIDLIVGGNYDQSGDLLAKGNTIESDGGSVSVTAAGNVTIGGNIQIFGGADAVGGDLTVTAAGTIMASPPAGSTQVFDASGGLEGGSIDLEAGPGLTVNATLNASGDGLGSDGGFITVNAAGNVTIGADVNASGSGSPDFGGFGGDLSVAAGGTLSIQGAADLDISGGSPDGEGGTADLSAGVDLLQSGRLLAQGAGGQAFGGTLLLNAGRLASLGALIDVHGGDLGGGGYVSVTASQIAALGEINGNGDGGYLLLTTAATPPSGPVVLGPVTVSGNVHAIGTLVGLGGNINVQGCDVTVAAPTGMLKTAGGSGADNLVQASGLMRIGGTLSALPTGTNRLQYLSTLPTIQLSAEISPTATQTLTPTLPPCQGAVVPVCGNGTIETGEGCDDHNTTACDGCSATCQIEACGNGTKECTEACDDGNAVAGDGCDSNCTPTACGNGIVTAGEECDDGNTVSGDGCDGTCHVEIPPGCGNHTVDSGEECDDGNNLPCDGCSPFCTMESCGNNTIDCPAGTGPFHEQCDDANTTACDGCSASCQVERCGNGVTECGELCDDGNLIDGDGCDSNCTPTGCANGVVSAGETCDDGNTTACDGCSATCQIECGNGELDCSEQCDLGADNGKPGKECNSKCQTAKFCFGMVPIPDCVPCAMDTDCDPRGVCAGFSCDPTGSHGGDCITVVPNCDDGNPCTDDSCPGAVGCVHTARSGAGDGGCSGGDACTAGTDGCTAGSCIHTAKLDCDDHDLCTDDSCAAGKCANVARENIPGILCKLDTFDAIVQGASATDLQSAPRQKITSMSGKIHSKVQSLQGSTGKKKNKGLKAAGRQLKAITKAITKGAHKHQISTAVAAALNTAVNGASQALQQSLTP